MKIMKIWKQALVMLLALSMTACSTQSDTSDKTEENKEEPIKMLVPMGAPSLSVLGLYGDEHVTIDTVDGTDVLRAQLAKQDGEYDVIIAPINLGAALLSKGKSEYLLDSVVTWGNLYIVGTDEDALQRDGMFAAFGEEAVPQKVLTSSIDVTTIQPEIHYFNSANEVQAQLLSQKAEVGLLAEPAATATIAKAKEKGIELRVLKDLQQEYKEQNGMEQLGYPQAALFIKKGSEEKAASYLQKAESFVTNATDDSIAEAVETATVDKLGIPSVQIAQKTWQRQNIRFAKASDVVEDIDMFLEQFSITLDASAYTK